MDKTIRNLINTRKELLDVLNKVPENLFHQPENLDSWSIEQVCQHLILTELLFTKAIQRGLTSNDRNTSLKPIHIVLDQSKKFESPEAAKPNINIKFTLNEIVSDLGKVRETFMKMLEEQADKTIFEK